MLVGSPPGSIVGYRSGGTAASIALVSDANVKMIAARLGHATTAIILDLCSHVLAGQNAAATAFAAALFACKEP